MSDLGGRGGIQTRPRPRRPTRPTARPRPARWETGPRPEQQEGKALPRSPPSPGPHPTPTSTT
eukprot:1519126-Alexandrium_andersonii.AAC.1